MKTINFSTNSARAFLKTLAISENRLSREQLEKAGTRNLTTELIQGHYLKENKDGSFSGTGKVKRAFAKEFQDRTNFGGSKSLKHSNGEFQITTYMHKKVLADVEIKTSKQLSEEHKKLTHSNEYTNKIEELKQKYEKEFETLNRKEDLDNTETLKKYELEVKLDVLNSKETTSPFDFEMKLPREEILYMANNISYDIENNDLYNEKQIEYLERAADELRNIYINNNSEIIEVSFEVITTSYTQERIIQKEVLREITGQNTIYLYS